VSRYGQRTELANATLSNWGKASTGIGVVAGYGIATGTPSPSGSYTDGGFTWVRIDFTASSTLVVSTAGLFDVLTLSGGGGGGTSGGNTEGGGGGSGAQLLINTFYIPAATYTVTVGGGGANDANGQSSGGTLGGGSGIATLKISPMAGVSGPPPWGIGLKGYNSSGASYRGGYGGNPAIAAVGLFGFAGGSSTGAGDNGGGGGNGGAGGTRTAGAGTASTFTGTSVTYCAGGLGGGTSGTVGAAGGANTGTGGGGCITTGTGTNGGSGFVSVRWRIA